PSKRSRWYSSHRRSCAQPPQFLRRNQPVLIGQVPIDCPRQGIWERLRGLPAKHHLRMRRVNCVAKVVPRPVNDKADLLSKGLTIAVRPTDIKQAADNTG